MTVNKAIASLVRDGWLRREAGNGTFVQDNVRIPAPVSLTIGFATPYSTIEEDYYLSSLLRGIQRATLDRAVSLKVIEASGRDLYSKISNAPIDGCILIDVLEHSMEDVERLSAEGKKVVVLGASYEDLSVPYVDSDNEAGTRVALDHLLSLGHRRIAGAFAYMGMSNSRQRHRTYLQFLEQNGLEQRRDYVLDLGNGVLPSLDSPEGLARVQQKQNFVNLLRSPNRPTAILCAGFQVALEMLQAAKQAGLRVPEDLSLVGFDDPFAARYLTPPLTTVRQPLEDMGASALDILFDWLHSGKAPQRSTVLEEALVIRSSTSTVNE